MKKIATAVSAVVIAGYLFFSLSEIDITAGLVRMAYALVEMLSPFAGIYLLIVAVKAWGKGDETKTPAKR